MDPQNLPLQDEILLSGYVVKCDQLQGKISLKNKGARAAGKGIGRGQR